MPLVISEHVENGAAVLVCMTGKHVWEGRELNGGKEGKINGCSGQDGCILGVNIPRISPC